MGKSAKILIRRMKSSIRERKGKCRISQKEIMNMFGRKKRKPLRQLITHKEPK
ncbi:tyrosine protein kinase, partial [Bacillus wiedmannii]